MRPENKRYYDSYYLGGDWGSYDKKGMEDYCRDNFVGGALSTLHDEYEKLGHNLGEPTN